MLAVELTAGLGDNVTTENYDARRIFLMAECSDIYTDLLVYVEVEVVWQEDSGVCWAGRSGLVCV